MQKLLVAYYDGEKSSPVLYITKVVRAIEKFAAASYTTRASSLVDPKYLWSPERHRMKAERWEALRGPSKLDYEHPPETNSYRQMTVYG